MGRIVNTIEETAIAVLLAAEIVWCQEEPKNQGAWSFVEPNIEWVLSRIKAKHTRPAYAGRAAAASPATGLAKAHKEQQEALVNDALTGRKR